MATKKSIKLLILFSIFCFNAFTREYNLNLMWINSTLDSNQKYFCATNKDEEDYKNKCINPIVSWLIKSSASKQVRLWYDSELTARDLIDKTVVDIKTTLGSNDKAINNLHFSDIRDIEEVKKNPEVFSDKLPVYFRSDLLRAIVADYLAKKYPHEYIVYADFNVPSLNHDELFDQQTLANLTKFGFVMAKNEASDNENWYENAFFILNPHNKSLMQAHRKLVIEINIKRAQEYLQSGYTTKSTIALRGGNALCQSKFDEAVFVSYKPMLEYYLYLEMIAEIVMDDDELANNLATSFDTNNDKGIKAMYDAYENSLWKDKLYAFSPLFGVGNSEKDHPWLFNKGFAKVSWVTLFENSNVLMRRLYLQPIKVSDVKQAEQLVSEEKQRRMMVNIDQYLSVHNHLPLPKFRFEFSTIFHADTFTPFVSLEKGIYSPSLMPIKDVKKPKSSFYNKPKPRGDGC